MIIWLTETSLKTGNQRPSGAVSMVMSLLKDTPAIADPASNDKVAQNICATTYAGKNSLGYIEFSH